MGAFESWSPEIEPELSTDAELAGILVELSSREPIFHRPEFGTTRADFEEMTVESFWEVGASGCRYSRKYVLDELEKRDAKPQRDVWQTKDFHCRKLALDTYLVTYTLLQDNERLTRRSTIWQTTPGGWKIVFHQGTVVEDAWDVARSHSMPQPPAKRWKHTILNGIAHAEHVLRGDRSAPKDPREIRNFLFLQYEPPLGSVIHATPAFEALKRAMPDAHITVAGADMAASVLVHNPYIDHCIVTATPFESFIKSHHAVREALQSMPPGERCVVTTIGNQRTRVALLALTAGKALRAGYTLAPEIYDIPLRFHPERGQIQGNLDILRSLGHDVSFCEPRMFFTRQDIGYAGELLKPSDEKSDAPRVAFVTQNSGGQLNQWSRERFQQVIASLARRCNATPVFFGTAAEAPAIESLRESLPNPGVSAAGKTTIPQLAALLAQCDLVVSLDTGAFHVSRAVGLPGVVIAPAWQSPLEWLPTDDPRYRVLRGPFIPKPPPGYWIEEVCADHVIDAALGLLKSFPPAFSSRAERVARATADVITG